MPPESRFADRHQRTIARLHERAGAARLGVGREELAVRLERSAAARFATTAAAAHEVESFIGSLHVDDLVLAIACSAGRPGAWDDFVGRYRPILYAAARAIAGEEVRARELADSLWAELYGLEERDGARRSLLDGFQGRSRLATWLRAILAQRHVDARRAEKRHESLDGERPPTIVADGPQPDAGDPDRAHYVAVLRDALLHALGALSASDRLRLSCYYLRSLTLAEIGRLVGEHESTVSRRLERCRRKLRKAVERELRRERKLSDEEIALCYDYAVEDWPFDLGAALSPQERRSPSFRAGGTP